MTIRWTRTAKANNQKIPQALGWAKEIAGYAQKSFGLGEIRVSMAVTGETGVVRWEVDQPDMKALEESLGKMMTDSTYWKMIDKAFDDDLFLNGFTHDEIFRSV